MSQRTSYAPGTPCWADVGARDVEAASTFYAALFGWDVEEAGDPEETGGYRMASRKGQEVAGLMGLMEEGQAPAWTTYIAVANADDTAARVSRGGGSVLAGPMDVMGFGRMAVFADPDGVAFAVWQPGDHAGAGLVNEPGALAWNELNTRDPGAAKAFYSDVFGWSFEDTQVEGVGGYTNVKLGDKPVGGMLDMRGRVPDEVPAHWLVYFAVEDTDTAIAKVEEGGGHSLVGPVDIPAGRFAIMADPDGAAFGVIGLTRGM